MNKCVGFLCVSIFLLGISQKKKKRVLDFLFKNKKCLDNVLTLRSSTNVLRLYVGAMMLVLGVGGTRDSRAENLPLRGECFAGRRHRRLADRARHDLGQLGRSLLPPWQHRSVQRDRR